MFKTTLYLDLQSHYTLRSLAARQDRTQSAVMRDAFTRYIQAISANVFDGLPPGMGAYYSGDPSLASNTRATIRSSMTKGLSALSEK